jgi:hypothetical protein
LWVCCGQHKKLVETAAFKLIENNLNQTFLEKVRVEISPQTDSTKIKQEILQDFSKNFQFELLEHQNQQNTTKQRLIETKKQLADKQKVFLLFFFHLCTYLFILFLFLLLF